MIICHLLILDRRFEELIFIFGRMHIGYIGCLNIQVIYVITNNFTTKNILLFFVSDLKIVYDNN